MRNQNKTLQLGFTIVELMVVVSIMAIIATIGIMNWSSQKSTRTINIAQSELVTNLRKVQSYAISNKITPTTETPKFYIMKFTNSSGTYTILAATGTNNTISSQPIETITMPTGAIISNLALGPVETGGPSAGEINNPSCIYIIFSASYGRTYFTSTNNCATSDLQNSLSSLPTLYPKASYNLDITIKYKTLYKGVKVTGLSGRVESY